MTSHLLLLLVLVLVLLSHLFLFHLSLIHHVNKVLGCEAQELGPRDALRRIGVGDGVGVRGPGLRVVRGRALRGGRGVAPCGATGSGDGVVVRGRGLRVVRGRDLLPMGGGGGGKRRRPWSWSSRGPWVLVLVLVSRSRATTTHLGLHR